MNYSKLFMLGLLLMVVPFSYAGDDDEDEEEPEEEEVARVLEVSRSTL